MNSATLSAIMIVGILVLALTIFGITEESATRSPLTPYTRQYGSTTAIGSLSAPMAQVDVGWKLAPVASRISSSDIGLVAPSAATRRPGLIAAPITARRTGAGATSTAVAPAALARPGSPVPLISFNGACRGI